MFALNSNLSGKLDYLGTLTESQAANVLKHLGISTIYANKVYCLSCSFGGYMYFIIGNETISGAGKQYGTQLAITNSGIMYRTKPADTEQFGNWDALQ